jgi:predicted component of type VI protein secretion system
VVELKLLSGKQAGASVVARRFPFRVGRAGDSGLRLEDDGVFERHFSIHLKSKDGFFLASEPPAVTAVNNQPITETRLRSGDVIQAGSASLRFALSPMRQRTLRPREVFVWVMLGVLCLAQVAVIYWLKEY